jgi:hypothetical protein
MAKTKKKVHIPKSKEQLIAEMKKSEKWQAKMKFVKEKFYPAILEIDSSIDDTKMFISSINSMMMEKFLGFMREMKFNELKMVDILDPKDVNYDKYVALLNEFNDMSVFDAKDMIEGMKGEIDTFLQDELKERKISSLKTKWIDEL